MNDQNQNKRSMDGWNDALADWYKSGSIANASGIEREVCADIANRQIKGLAKYGMSVADNPACFQEWLQHAYEETLDTAIYLKRSITEIEKDAIPPLERVSPRIIELCERLTCVGNIDGRLSASELHEICNFIFELNLTWTHPKTEPK